MSTYAHGRSIDTLKLSPLVDSYEVEELKNPHSLLFQKMINEDYFNTQQKIEIFKYILVCLAVVYFTLALQAEAQQREEERKLILTEERQKQDIAAQTQEEINQKAQAEVQKLQELESKIQALQAENNNIKMDNPAIATWVDYQQKLASALMENLKIADLKNTDGSNISAVTSNKIAAIIKAPMPIKTLKTLVDSNKEVKQFITARDSAAVNQLVYGNVLAKEFSSIFELARHGLASDSEISVKQMLMLIKLNKEKFNQAFPKAISVSNIQSIAETLPELLSANTVTSLEKYEANEVSINFYTTEKSKLNSVPDAPALSLEEFNRFGKK
jgi:hypothetical protein